MCLEIGNKVAVLDDAIKGVIKEVRGEVFIIEDENGMIYEFPSSDLVKIDVEQRELSKYINIDDSFLKDKESFGAKKKSVFKKTKNEVVMEVDLHAEKLVKSTRGMDNYDILSLQLDVAKRKLEYCVKKRISKIVFIHGVGEGVLKTELGFLFNKYPVKHYDASYQRYGLGATEVYIYQNA